MTTNEMFIGAADQKFSLWCKKTVRQAKEERQKIFNPNRKIKLYAKREKALKAAKRKSRKYGKNKVTCKYNTIFESYIVEWYIK